MIFGLLSSGSFISFGPNGFIFDKRLLRNLPPPPPPVVEPAFSVGFRGCSFREVVVNCCVVVVVVLCCCLTIRLLLSFGSGGFVGLWLMATIGCCCDWWLAMEEEIDVRLASLCCTFTTSTCCSFGGSFPKLLWLRNGGIGKATGGTCT